MACKRSPVRFWSAPPGKAAAGCGLQRSTSFATSRVYTTTGDTLDHTYEADDETVTIWGGPKGSPAAFRGSWSDDRAVLRGAWEWPGGGYAATMTRIPDGL